MGPKTRCPHVSDITLTLTEINYKKKQELFCQKCDDSGINQWLCLYRQCSFIGCGQKGNDHSSDHHKIFKHSMAINLYNLKIYCYECDFQVIPNNNIPQFTFRESPEQQPTVPSPMKHTAVMHQNHTSLPHNSEYNYDDDDYDDDDDDDDSCRRSRGLTGLRNLGNTCYMNAGLQALSNCPQLTQYFLECAGLIVTEKKPMLSVHYKRLLQEMWHKKRPSYVIPSGVCSGIKMVHPMFRGYAQQDSQEFLRCFMDQLHEELKEPLVSLVEANEEGGDVTSGGMETSSLVRTVSNSSLGASEDASPGSTYTGDSGVELGGDTASLLPPGSEQSKRSSAQHSLDFEKKKRQIQYKSIISTVFNGKLLSSVQCLTCERVSSTKEVFQDLSLPISSRGDYTSVLASCSPSSAAGAGGSVGLVGNNVTMEGGGVNPTHSGSAADNNYLSLWWFYWFYGWMKSWFVGPTIKLQDCLDSFFSEDELKGDNMYSCERCQKLRNGLKSSRVLELPEVICIHLKRFRHNFNYSSKISSYVSFPIEGLDMAPYLHPDCTDRVTTYDLVGAICHKGTAGGGHYTAYAFNYISQTWYEFDDEEVTEVDVNTVAGTEAYILFYRKQDEKMLPVRERADQLMQSTGEESLLNFYLSRAWIVRFNTSAEPGPISNDDFLCRHGALQPSKAHLKEELAMEVSQELWNYLYKIFGGGPAVTHLYPCSVCQDAEEKLRARQQHELSTVVHLHEEFRACEDPPSIYAISLRWFKEWEDFARGKENDPPGPIDNSNIVITRGGQMNLRSVSEYGQMSRETWAFLHAIYGGGPELCMKEAPRASSPEPTDHQVNGYTHPEEPGVDNGDEGGPVTDSGWTENGPLPELPDTTVTSDAQQGADGH